MPYQDYEARDNLVLTHSIGHVFDMHGMDEHTMTAASGPAATIRVHDNTVLVARPVLVRRARRPATGAWFYDNCLARRRCGRRALQRYYFGNFHVDTSPTGSAAANLYGRSARIVRPYRWCTATGGTVLAQPRGLLDRPRLAGAP